MPETSTSTDSKPKTKTNTKPRVKPDVQTKVHPGVQRAINAYIKADACVQSKLWPMVEVALDLLDDIIKLGHVPAKDYVNCLATEFRMAFIKAKSLQKGQLDKDPEYHRFLMVSLNVASVASLGRATVETNRKQGVGFWKLLDCVHKKEADAGHFTTKGNPGPAPKPAKPAANAKRKGEAEQEEDEPKAEAKSGNVKVPKATPEWRERFRHIIQHEAEAFVEELEFCVNRGWLPDGEWLETIKSYLAGE